MNEPLDDKSRFVKVLKLLPENFIDDFVRGDLWNASYPWQLNSKISKYDNYSKEILSEFSNPKINKAWKAFNKLFYALEKFLADNFWVPEHSLRDYFYLRPDIHHNFHDKWEYIERREKPEAYKDWCDKASVEWWKAKSKLDNLAEEFEKVYKDFIKIAKKEIEREEKPRKRWWEKTWVQFLGIVGAIASIIGIIFYIFLK